MIIIDKITLAAATIGIEIMKESSIHSTANKSAG